MDFFVGYRFVVGHEKQSAARRRSLGVFKQLALFALLILQANIAHALSTACTTLNSVSGTTSYTNRFYGTDFATGESLSLSFTDTGQNSGASTGAELVNIRSRDTASIFFDYRSNTGSQGSHSASVSASQLAASGLYIRITAGTYIGPVTISCTGAVSTDAKLSSLALSAGTLSPSFSSSTTSYSASVDNSTATLTLRPTASDSGATITVNGSAVASGADSQSVALGVGTTNISVAVTAADQATTQTYTVSVTRAEAAPSVGSVTASVAANSSNNPITLAITGNATSVAVPTAPAHGTATVSGTSISYTPTAGYSGSDSFTYTATNGSGTSAPATVTMTITQPSLSLTPSSGSLSAGQVGTAYSQTISASAGTAPYTYSASGLPGGLTLASSTGIISGTPTVAGSYTVLLTVADANHASGSATYTLLINDAAPVAGAVVQSVAANSSGNAVPLALSGGTATSVAVQSAPTHGQATASGLTISYTPTAGFSGSDSFTYTATNASGTSAPATVSITVSATSLNVSPSSGALPGGQVGTAYSQSISASGGTAPYTYSATGLSSGLNLASTGVISGTPSVVGSYTVSVLVTDTNSVSGSASYTLTVIDAPPVAGAVTETVNANSASNAIALNLSGGTAVSVAVASSPLHGQATASGRTISYTPAAGFSGTDSFTYTATNAAGTSPAATVTLTVSAQPLTLSPAAGALPSVAQGSAYDLLFSVAGGTAPYTFAASGLPSGLVLNTSSGRLTGTPVTQGNSTFTVTATDASSQQASAVYTLSVTQGSPTAVDNTATVGAGQSVSVDLSTGASGGPFTSATLLDTPAQAMGTARLSGVVLTFTSTSTASGTLALRYALINQSGTSLPATLSIQINARSNPAQNQEVVGTLSAQAQSASQFAQAQVNNFSNRLEQLHDLNGHRNAFNLRFGPDQARHDRPDEDVDLFRSRTALEEATANDQWALQRAAADTGTQPAPVADIAFWTGGYVDFGKYRSSTSKVDNRMTGISAGADYRVSPALTVGMGIGVGRDRSEIGESSTSRGESYSAAMYGSYHPGQVFLDALLGYSWLSFDSDRYVSETGRYANGTRKGDQLFGSLSSGYEIKGQNWLLSPYGRLDASTTRLHAYSESHADIYNLEYAEQRINLFAGVVGMRGQYGIALGSGQLNLRSRLEYSQSLNADSNARVGYVDAGDLAYSIRTEGLDQNTVSAYLGADFVWASGLTAGIGYQGTRAVGEDSRSDSISLRVVRRF